MEPEQYDYENDNADSYDDESEGWDSHENVDDEEYEVDEEWGDDFEEDSRNNLMYDYLKEI